MSEPTLAEMIMLARVNDRDIDEDYVAWCRYTEHSIVTCDSDAPGAFKVYRGPRQVPEETVSSEAHQQWMSERKKQDPLNPQPIGTKYLTERITLGTEYVLVLSEHWLFEMRCDHIAKKDQAACSCGWVGEWQRSVGCAAEAWAQHAIERMEAIVGARLPREEDGLSTESKNALWHADKRIAELGAER